MATQVELYDALKDSLGEEKAAFVSSAIVAPSGVATKADLDLLSVELRKEFAEAKADTRQMLLTFFVPLWIGVYGTLMAVIAGVAIALLKL